MGQAAQLLEMQIRAYLTIKWTCQEPKAQKGQQKVKISVFLIEERHLFQEKEMQYPSQIFANPQMSMG